MLGRWKEKNTVAAAANAPLKEHAARPQRGRILGEVMKEKDEGLFLFLEMRRREKERQTALADDKVPDSLPPPGLKPGSSPSLKTAFLGISSPDDLLNSEGSKSDYDWLLTPPGTPLIPFLDKETRGQRSPLDLTNGAPKRHPAAPKSRLANPHEPPAKDSSAVLARRKTASLDSGGIRRMLTGLPALPLASKSARPSTPTSRALAPTKPAARSCTPASRPSVITPQTGVHSKSTATPTRRPSTPSSLVKCAPDRPLSASRSRPGAQSAVITTARLQPRSSPAIVRSAPNGEGISPVAIGSKMVERAVNLRRLAPPSRQDGPRSHHPGTISGSRSSGFGRTMSRTSLDMAIRHMDIRRSVRGNLARSRSASGVDSPLATRSNASSSGSERALPCPSAR